jgi:hypothetical protein
VTDRTGIPHTIPRGSWPAIEGMFMGGMFMFMAMGIFMFMGMFVWL